MTESPGWARITESSVGPPSGTTVAVDSAVTTGDTDRLGVCAAAAPAAASAVGVVVESVVGAVAASFAPARRSLPAR